MIKHISLASSSSGNCHLFSFDNGLSYIMVDCGVPFTYMKKELFNLGIMFHQIKGCIVTHEHRDHILASKDISKYFNVFMTEETYNAYNESFDGVVFLNPGEVLELNDTKILPFSVKHDAVNPVNFLIKNSDGEYTLYVTDTGSLEFKLESIRPSYIVIEANFDEKVLLEKIKEYDEKYKDVPIEDVPNEYKRINARNNRNILTDSGHLSIEKTIDILNNQINLSLCHQISLCHVSKTNGSKDFHSRVRDAINGLSKVVQLSFKKSEVYDIINKNERY